MANEQSVIELVFEGVDKTGAATQSAIGNAQKFSGNIQSATQPLADFTLGAVKMEAALLTAGVAVTALSVKIAGDFDSAFREIATLIDEPIEGLTGFKNAILDYSRSSTQPLEQVTQAIYSSISAGVQYGDAINAVSQAERLAVAGRGDLNASTLVLVSSLNAYGLGMDQAERFSDALFTTVKQGQTTLPELSSSLSLVTGTAATLEVPFETLLASIATLTSLGTPTSQAITQINGVLSAFLKPSKEASDIAKELGIDFSATAIKTKGLEVVLQEVATATGGSQEQMAKLFGSQEALRAVFPLTGAAAGKFGEVLTAIGNSTGATTEAFNRMAGDVEQSTQRIQNSITGLLVAIGSPLLDEFGGVSVAISGIFNALGNSANKGQVAELVAYIESQFQGLQKTLETVAQNLPAALEKADLSGFTDGLDAVSDAFSTLFSGIDLSSVDGLANAVTLVGQAFNGLSQFTAGVIESLKPLFEQVTKIGGGLDDLSPDLFKAAGEMAGFATQANVLAGSINGMIPAIQGLLAVIGINQAVGLVGGLTKATEAASGLGGALAKGGLIAAAGAAGYAIGTLANEATELATGTSISTWVTDTAIAFGALDDGATNIVNSLNEVPGSLGAVASSADDSAKAIAAADDEMQNIARNSYEATDSTYNFSDALNDAEDKMSALGNSGDLLPKLYGDIDKTTESTESLAKAGEKVDLKERLAIIEAQSAITVAALQSDAEKIKSAFESVNVGLQSTGDLLGSLFGNLGDADNFRDRFQIEDQIKLENERRDQELASQEKLINSQLRMNALKEQALKSGQSLITVSGDGLQPHLEAFMWEILEAVQVRVNADGLDMLLGA